VAQCEIEVEGGHEESMVSLRSQKSRSQKSKGSRGRGRRMMSLGSQLDDDVLYTTDRDEIQFLSLNSEKSKGSKFLEDAVVKTHESRPDKSIRSGPNSDSRSNHAKSLTKDPFPPSEKTPPPKGIIISPAKDADLSDSQSKFSGGSPRHPRKKRPIIPPLRPKRKVPMLKGNLFKSKAYNDPLDLEQVHEDQLGELTTERIKSNRSERPAPLSTDRRREFYEDIVPKEGNITDRSHLRKHGSSIEDRSHRSKTGQNLLSARSQRLKITDHEVKTAREKDRVPTPEVIDVTVEVGKTALVKLDGSPEKTPESDQIPIPKD
jgi:hypothetical protein